MEIELISQNPGMPSTGIGRYTRELFTHLQSMVSVRIIEHTYPPFSRYIDPFHYFPTGVKSHREGSILHFLEDFGCSQMLWRPIRPAIATSHDLGFLAWPPEARMHKAIDRVLLHLSYLGLKRMDAIIAVSEYSRQSVIQHLQIPANRVFTVYSGNNNEHFKPIDDAREKLAEYFGLPDDPNTKNILYVGAEYPRKNLATILKVLKTLPQNVRLLKVGKPGGERFRVSTQKKIAELEISDRVVFLDEVPDKMLPLLYNAADVYICASYLEGFGHPVLEAMACGTPVVCSNAASLPEITGDAAILVPPNDVQAFTEAVHSILCPGSTMRERLRASGQQQAALFSWEKTAARVTEVYQFVAKNEVGFPG